MASMKSEVVDWSFVGWTLFGQDWITTRKGYRADVRAVRNYAINPNTAQVFSTLSNTPIAIARLRWHLCEYDFKTLSEQTLLGNGLVRFRLGDGEGVGLEMGLETGEFLEEKEVWLLQAWSIFHALGITLEDNLEAITLVTSFASLKGSLSSSQVQRQRRLQQPIYLFVHPLPANLPLIPLNGHQQIDGQTPSLHFWSFREDGNSPLSPQICHSLGLPTVLHLHYSTASELWTNDTYKIIRQYQALRGFDPTTTAFAQHLRYLIIHQPIRDLARFKEINEEQNSGSSEFHIKYAKYDSYGFAIYASDEEVESLGMDSDEEGSSNPRGQQDLNNSVPSGNIPAQVAEGGFIINPDHGTGQRRRTGAGWEAHAEGTESRDLLNQTPECLYYKNDTTNNERTAKSHRKGSRHTQSSSERDAFSTNLDHQAYLPTDIDHFPAHPADRACQALHSLSSTYTDPSLADISLSMPFDSAQPVGSLEKSQHEMKTTTYKPDAAAETRSAYADPSIYSVVCNDATSTAGNTEGGRWSRTLSLPSFTANSRLYDPPVFDTDLTVSYPLGSTIHTPVYSTSTVGPANGYASFTSCDPEGHSAPQQQPSPHPPPTAFSYEQPGLPRPAKIEDWHDWSNFDFGNQGYE
ncbi:hypothetical protein PM082_013973 [Marasmius tenuissimus]|nr:hypothetical protein PM082_013973 [Marasmius tenuissimus]